MYSSILLMKQNSPIKGTRKFSPFGVPTDALFTRETTMGVYPNTFSVNGFGLRYAGVKPNTTFWSYIKVTKEGCMPVKTQLFAEAGAAPGHGPGDRDLDMSETRDFFNSVLGIEDPGVFVPPSGCTKLGAGGDGNHGNDSKPGSPTTQEEEYKRTLAVAAASAATASNT